MFPIRDDIPPRSAPLVNYAVVVVCAVVFVVQLLDAPKSRATMIELFAMIPARVSNPDAEIEIVVEANMVESERGTEIETVQKIAAPAAVPPVLTMLTCIFLHGGLMHIVGNMWFLYIFGDNVEDRLGHVGYALFYLFCGSAASLAHYFTDTTSPIPTVGASGAIAGVMGAYFVWYWNAKVQALVPVGPMVMMTLPAPLFLAIWFLIQFAQGAMTSAAGGGVAWWAHVGGFLAGVVIAIPIGLLPGIRPLNPQRRTAQEGLIHWPDRS